MIILTGAAGFIGSYLAGALNRHGFTDLVLVDDVPAPESGGDKAAKQANWDGKVCRARLSRTELFDWWADKGADIQFVLHLGARTDTAETDEALFERLNLDYSKQVWAFCTRWQIPLIYASSAATYGRGEHGFSDDHAGVPMLRPQNAYARSKQAFDEWVLSQPEAPFFWAGLKFFNVYGPNEYHKGAMASVIYHATRQILATGELKLFQSHHPDYAHGEQMRDFIYVRDVAAVILALMEQRSQSGLFNLGTGRARSFLDLAHAVFHALGREPAIRFVPTPEHLRPGYQYFTQAEMGKLRQAGYEAPFEQLEDGVRDYVQNFLQAPRVY